MFIKQANAVARAQSVDTMSFDTSNSQDTVTSMQERVIDSDTSADELALDYPSPMSRTKRQKVNTSKYTPFDARKAKFDARRATFDARRVTFDTGIFPSIRRDQ